MSRSIPNGPEDKDPDDPKALVSIAHCSPETKTDSVPGDKWMVRTKSLRNCHGQSRKLETEPSWMLGCPVLKHLIAARFAHKALDDMYQRLRTWHGSEGRAKAQDDQEKRMPKKSGGCALGSASSSSASASAPVAAPRKSGQTIGGSADTLHRRLHLCLWTAMWERCLFAWHCQVRCC